MDFSAIDQYVSSEIRRLGIPGVALGIVQNNEIVHVQGFGRADASGRPVTPQTPFYIGSLTKSFTALAIMQLVEAGKLALDDPLIKYLPWFTLADASASARITLRHILNQTTGISEKDGNNSWCSPASVQHQVGALSKITPKYSAGEKYQYSNINYSIAGLIIEVVSGQSYADYIQQHIYKPLHMQHSYVSRDAAVADGLAEGHYYRFGHARAGLGPLPPALLPAGLLISSAQDMTHYMIAHLNDGRFHQNKILSPQGIASLHSPAAPLDDPLFHYAMGWSTGPIDGESVLMHNGDTGYFHSTIILLPEQHWGVVLLANASGFAQLHQVDGICRNLVQQFKQQSPPLPVKLPAMLRYVYWGILITPLFMLLGIGINAWQIYNCGLHHPVQWTVTGIIYLTITAVSLLYLPGRIPLSLPAMRALYPELAASLFISGMLGICWSALCFLMIFM